MKKIPLGVKVFTLLWALALFLPPVREMERTISAYWSNGDPWLVSSPTGVPADDPITIEWKMEATDYPTRGRGLAKDLGKLDALMARFPGQRWIAAARLRRILAFESSLNLDDGTAPTRDKTPAALSAKELERAAQVAATAGKQEPDNSFWPWMEAFFRFALHDNDAGTACMEQAGGAPRFDDYMQSTARGRIALWKKYYHPAFEQKEGVWYGLLSPHLSAMRRACRAAAYQALLARKHGDTARAVRLGAAILRTSKVLHRDAWAAFSALMAEQSTVGSLEEVLGEPLPKAATPPDHMEMHKSGGAPRMTTFSPEAVARHKRTLKAKWAQFARANGRPDVASDADWVVLPSVGEDLHKYGELDLWKQFGLPPAQCQMAALAPFLLFGVGAFCYALAMVWLVGALFAWRGKKGESGASPSRGQVVACANFGFWALFGALLVTFGGWLPEWLDRFMGQGVALTPFVPFIEAAFQLGCWLVPVAFVAWKRDRRFRWVREQRPAIPLSRGMARARVWAWLFFLTFALFVASSVSSGASYRGDVWDGTPFQLPVAASLAVVGLICALVIEALRFGRSGRMLPRLRLEGELPARPGASLTLRIARVGAWFGVAWCVFSTLAVWNGGLDLPPIAAALQVPLGILLLVVAVWLGRKTGRGDGFAFRLATRTAGVLSLVGSFAFLLLALAAWPLRAELNHQLDRRLSMREEDWMKEQLAKFPPSPR